MGPSNLAGQRSISKTSSQEVTRAEAETEKRPQRVRDSPRCVHLTSAAIFLPPPRLRKSPSPDETASGTPVRLLRDPVLKLESHHLPSQLKKNGLETTKELQIRNGAKELPKLGRYLNTKRWGRGGRCTFRGISTFLVNTVIPPGSPRPPAPIPYEERGDSPKQNKNLFMKDTLESVWSNPLHLTNGKTQPRKMTRSPPRGSSKARAKPPDLFLVFFHSVALFLIL